MSKKELFLDFHGRFIDALGIQMYQKPTAAIAELIANAWDADASSVKVTLPTSISTGSEIAISDDGHGMTFEECQDFYLKVGRNRRDGGSDKTRGGRPVLGRKGIGKFAGFGIAATIMVETISDASGERTVFKLDLGRLRSGEFIEAGKHTIEVVAAQGPNDARKAKHGTTIRLQNLTHARKQNAKDFATRMARRFALAANAQQFDVRINNVALSSVQDPGGVEFDFPSDYKTEEKPPSLIRIDNKEGVEKIGDDEIRWRMRFSKETIGDEEFRGVSIFCGVKIAQTPFFFELSGGLSGQHGVQYLFGHVQADFIDQLGDDIITTERQRINWEHPEARQLLSWGQDRLKELLAIWTERRAEERIRQIDKKLAPFSPRIERLQPSERKTVISALRKIASIPTLGDQEFVELATSLLTAWEQGRLRDLIDRIASLSDNDAGVIVAVMGEAQTLSVLQIAEVIKLKLDLIRGLRKRIEEKDLENAIRDYISSSPWLIRPELEVYEVEISLRRLLDKIAKEIGLDDDPDFAKRVDLLVGSGDHLVLLEFMRPGVTIDRDHIDRFTQYADEIRARLSANTAGPYRRLTGRIVADRLERSKPGNQAAIKRLEQSDLYAMDWDTLLADAERQFKDYFKVMVDRSSGDPRVDQLTPKAAKTNTRTQGKKKKQPS